MISMDRKNLEKEYEEPFEFDDLSDQQKEKILSLMKEYKDAKGEGDSIDEDDLEVDDTL